MRMSVFSPAVAGSPRFPGVVVFSEIYQVSAIIRVTMGSAADMAQGCMTSVTHVRCFTRRQVTGPVARLAREIAGEG
jgi:dienelactone hydrolase